MNKLVTLLLTVSALSIALPAGLAHHCGSVTTSEGIEVVEDLYVMIDRCVPGCVSALVVYEESNGREGLQRGDRVVDNTCHGRISPDTRIL